MKSSKFKKIIILIALAVVVINIFSPYTNVFADIQILTTDEIKAEKQKNRMLYDFRARARVRAYFHALETCSKAGGLATYFALDGKWGKYNTKDGSGHSQKIKNAFLAGIRDLNTSDALQEFRCSYGNLIAAAFNEFFTFAGDSRSWNKLSLKEKKEFFCSSGWFGGAYKGERGSLGGGDRKKSCEAVIDLISQKGKSQTDWNKYTLQDLGNIGTHELSEYLKEKLFKGLLTPEYYLSNAEKYEAMYETVYRVCAERTRSSTVVPQTNNIPVYYVGKGAKTVTGTARWFDMKSRDNAYYSVPTSYTSGYFDCGHGWIQTQLISSSGYTKGAIKELTNWLKAECFINYQEFYTNQYNYHLKISSDDQMGEYEEAYDNWFNNLPLPTNIDDINKESQSAIGKACFTTSNSSPFAKCDIADYIEYLLATNPDPNSPSYSGFVAEGEQEPSASSGGSNSDPNCMKGDNSLLWILCPILEGIAKASQTAYENYIAPALQINPDLIGDQTSSVNTATYDAWDKFRTMANIIFTIMILVVIFSQLTGYGIDNYGIKKLLPKLIIAAVLINLSFLICQLAVDLSNILGSGLNDLMNSMGNGLRMPTGVSVNGTSVGVGFGGVILVGVVILVAIVAISGNIAFLLPLLAAAISMAVAIFFLFVLLAVRQVGVIVLVVLSPLAFVCYMLPNAKKLFDKWLKAFEGLLLLYPICGLIVGGGNFVSRLILSTSAGGGDADFFMSLISMIACIAPVFFIPVLLKGSFTAMGNIGAAISGFGKRAGKSLGGKANKAASGSDTFRRANNFVGRNLTFSKRRRAAAAADTDKRLKEKEAAQTVLTDREFKNKTEADLQKEWNDAFDKGGDHGRLAALTNVMTSRYGSGAASFMAKTLAGKDIVGNKNAQASMQVLRNTMMSNSTLAGNMKNKASDAFQMISNAGLVHDEDTNENYYANLGYYSEHNAISKDVKDWSTQSADTLIRAIDSGGLGKDTIEQILNSTDPSIQSGIQSDPGKASILQAAMGGATGLGSMSKTQIEDFVQKYKDGLKAQAESTKAAAEQAAQEIKDSQRKYQEDTLNALNKINEQLGKHNGPSSDQTFDGGAGI